MKETKLQSVVWKEGEAYVAQCLSVGVASHGSTKKEALEMLQEALELYFEDDSGEVQDIEGAEMVFVPFSRA